MPKDIKYPTTARSLVAGFTVLSPEGRKVKVERSYALSQDAWFVRFDTGNNGEIVSPDAPFTVISDN
jgi:hypothetical protein